MSSVFKLILTSASKLDDTQLKGPKGMIQQLCIE